MQIECSIRAISARLPGLKETEVVSYACRVMRKDFKDGIITSRIWDEIPKYKFNDEKISFPETRLIQYDEAAYDSIVIGRDDDENSWAYLKKDGVLRARFVNMITLILFYTRKKLEDEDKKPAISAARRDTTVENRLELLNKIVNMMMNYDARTTEKLRRIEEIVKED